MKCSHYFMECSTTHNQSLLLLGLLYRQAKFGSNPCSSFGCYGSLATQEQPKLDVACDPLCENMTSCITSTFELTQIRMIDYQYTTRSQIIIGSESLYWSHFEGVQVPVSQSSHLSNCLLLAAMLPRCSPSGTVPESVVSSSSLQT